MKIPAFLITLRALEILVGAVCKAVPAGWFNWTTADGTLSRITLVDEVVPQIVDQWKTLVHAENLHAVTVLTCDCDPKAQYLEVDPASISRSSTVYIDLFGDTKLIEMIVALIRPEREYLMRWAALACGIGDQSGWLNAPINFWRTYADGLRTWVSEPQARKLLADLDQADYVLMSEDLNLTPEEFQIPTEIEPDGLKYSYFPSVYDPAFAVGVKDGVITTFGIRAEPDEWMFDKSGAIRARLEALKTSVLQTA